jgi:hypothetical protein
MQVELETKIARKRLFLMCPSLVQEFVMFTRWIGAAAFAALLAAVMLVESPREPQAVAQPAAAEANADLAMVPADAVGFVHIRLADLWKNEMFAGLRKTWERAGEKALATLDKQFVPAPSSISRVTAFVLLDEPMQEPYAFGIIAFSQPFDTAKVVQSYLPNVERKVAGNRTIYTNATQGFEVSFPDNRHVLIGQSGTLALKQARTG